MGSNDTTQPRYLRWNLVDSWTCNHILFYAIETNVQSSPVNKNECHFLFMPMLFKSELWEFNKFCTINSRVNATFFIIRFSFNVVIRTNEMNARYSFTVSNNKLNKRENFTPGQYWDWSETTGKYWDSAKLSTTFEYFSFEKCNFSHHSYKLNILLSTSAKMSQLTKIHRFES